MLSTSWVRQTANGAAPGHLAFLTKNPSPSSAWLGPRPGAESSCTSRVGTAVSARRVAADGRRDRSRPAPQAAPPGSSEPATSPRLPSAQDARRPARGSLSAACAPGTGGKMPARWLSILACTSSKGARRVDDWVSAPPRDLEVDLPLVLEHGARVVDVGDPLVDHFQGLVHGDVQHDRESTAAARDRGRREGLTG